MYGVCGVIGLMAIKSLFFQSSAGPKEDSYSGIMLENEDGKLLITNETLESIVSTVVEGVSANTC